MTLDDWLAVRGRGAIHKLHLDSGVSLPVIARARKGCASLANAITLHEHTDGEVPISRMTTERVPESLERPTVRARRAARGRTRARVA